MDSVEWKSAWMLRRSASILARIAWRVLSGSPAAAAAPPASVPTPCGRAGAQQPAEAMFQDAGLIPRVKYS